MYILKKNQFRRLKPLSPLHNSLHHSTQTPCLSQHLSAQHSDGRHGNGPSGRPAVLSDLSEIAGEISDEIQVRLQKVDDSHLRRPFLYRRPSKTTAAFGNHIILDYEQRFMEKMVLGLDLDPDDIEQPPPPQTVRVFSEQFSEVRKVDLSYLIEEYGRIEFTSSSQGLVCLTFDEFPERVVLWNPATRQRRLLPSPADCNRLWGVGIGLDEASGDWKVVRLCMESDDPSTEAPDESPVRAHVLTKGSTVWRDGGVSGIEGTFRYRGMIPIAAAGALHWNFFPGHFITGETNIEGILSFDLTDEVFRFANAPGPEEFTLCSWRSSLAALTYKGTQSATLSVASPSLCGDGLTWSKLMEFNLRVKYVWREHYLLYEMMSRYFTLLLMDPEVPGEVRNLSQHIRASDPIFEICDYVASIISVF